MFDIKILIVISTLVLLNLADCATESKAAHLNVINNIFMIQSDLDQFLFSVKEMCAIESAARHNPNTRVYVFKTRAQLNTSASNLLEKYPNIQIMDFVPENFLKGEIYRFWEIGDLIRSTDQKKHTDDFLRMALLWRYGGLFVDINTISLKSFQPFFDLKTNGFANKRGNISDTILLFSEKKHPLLLTAIEFFISKFKIHHWRSSGLEMISDAITNYCDVSSFDELDFFDARPAAFRFDPSYRCHNVTVFPESYFNPLSTVQQKIAFMPDSSDDLALARSIKNAYLIKFDSLNKLEADEMTSAPDADSFVDMLAETHCEFTFDYMKANNLEFS